LLSLRNRRIPSAALASWYFDENFLVTHPIPCKVA
jgi:hypothetical protein